MKQKQPRPIPKPRVKMSEDFIPVLEASKMLGIGQDLLKTAMRKGSFPPQIGIALCSESGKWSYRIFRKQFMEWRFGDRQDTQTA